VHDLHQLLDLARDRHAGTFQLGQLRDVDREPALGTMA
jgi:hypothetical protein